MSTTGHEIEVGHKTPEMIADEARVAGVFVYFTATGFTYCPDCAVSADHQSVRTDAHGKPGTYVLENTSCDNCGNGR